MMLEVNENTAAKTFVVWPWDAAPASFQEAILNEDSTKAWVVVTNTTNLADGLPLWLDMMNPWDQVRVDLPNGITLIGA